MNNLSGKMLALTALVGAMIAMSGCGGPAVVPASYDTYTVDDGSFKILYPAEWKADGGGRSGYAWAKFTSGDAEISVDASAVGSLMGDIAKSGSLSMGIQGNQQDRAPVAMVHEDEREGFEEDSGVQEQKPSVMLTGFGEARKSEFTGKPTFGGAIHGCRVTTLSSEKRIRVVCKCPESEWEALKPAFDKVIESVARATPQH